MLPEDIGGFASFLRDLQVDEELIQRIQKDLLDIASQIHHTGFQKYTVDQTVYGQAQIGWSLGYHHSLAHQKVSDSLTAILEDLTTFRKGFDTFRKTVEDADSTSASYSQTITKATQKLDYTAGFKHSHDVDHHYHTGGDTNG